MHQDDALFRQLLALNDSIEALKQADAMSLSSASSLSSLPELADEESCSPSSTLSSVSSGRQSHLSSHSANYLVSDNFSIEFSMNILNQLISSDGRNHAKRCLLPKS